LFVGGAAQRQIDVVGEEPVVGVDPVTRGVDVRQVGAHVLVDGDNPAYAEGDSGGCGQLDIWPDAGDDQDDLAVMTTPIR
jgi:hypothetical protein